MMASDREFQEAMARLRALGGATVTDAEIDRSILVDRALRNRSGATITDAERDRYNLVDRALRNRSGATITDAERARFNEILNLGDAYNALPMSIGEMNSEGMRPFPIPSMRSGPPTTLEEMNTEGRRGRTMGPYREPVPTTVDRLYEWLWGR